MQFSSDQKPFKVLFLFFVASTLFCQLRCVFSHLSIKFFFLFTVSRLIAHSTQIWNLSIRAINVNYALNNVNLKLKSRRKTDEFIKIGAREKNRVRMHAVNNKPFLPIKPTQQLLFCISIVYLLLPVQQKQHRNDAILVCFGEKSCWYERIGPCNQDQTCENKCKKIQSTKHDVITIT